MTRSELQPSPDWRRALPGFLLALAAVLFLFQDTGLAMVEIWNRSETFAHAFVVPPIALWLIWRQRAVLAALSPWPDWRFLGPMAVAALVWLLGELVAVNAATQFAFTALLILVVPLTLGWPVARSIAFPLGFLFFCVPFGEFVMPQLMEWTANFTVAALRASGIPVFREGLQFIIPSGNWSVVEACSGIRYLMASVMVGTLFAYLNYRSLKRRWIFVGVAAALPLAANWVRAYLIVMLGHLSGNKLATGADHLIYGWVFFGIVMFAMFMIGARWAEPDPDPRPAPAESQPQAAPQDCGASKPANAALLWITPVALVALLAVPLGLLHRLVGEGSGAPVTLSAADLNGNGWTQRAEPQIDFKPAFEKPRAEMQASYVTPEGEEVRVYLGYYRHQHYDSKLISSNNVLVQSKDKKWAQVSAALRERTTGSGPSIVRAAELRGFSLASSGVEAAQDKRLRVWQFYWINGRPLTRDWQAKLWGAGYRLLGRGDDAAVVVLAVDKATAGSDDALLERYLSDNWGRIDSLLRNSRDAAAHTDAAQPVAPPKGASS
ncbi:exosortase A [Roseateles koreensis]|uniref:Exosortase A n=1 Tax=Roseateles koreensis TaxID=2987526 RepID=A0ABT5KUX9_9BURK|nr:exosortase A [Roseateles koreensis]MDC8786173.1 exosortase A [Roseateles koreensis]